MSATSMPSIFFGHGSPTTVLTDNVYTETWKEMADRFPKPKAIICVSAHWFTNGTFVTAMERPRTIHDFGPLAPELFEMQYPAPGSPELAQRLKQDLAPVDVGLDMSWGFDHGAWTVLSKAYPEHDVPVVQLSLDGTKPPAWHLQQSQKLQKYRDEGILIAGSGNAVHNLSVMQWGDNVPAYDWAIRFRDFISQSIKARDFEAVSDYRSQGQDAQLAVPHPDHFLPLLYVLGASRENDDLAIETDSIEFKSLSMTSFVFSQPASAM